MDIRLCPRRNRRSPRLVGFDYASRRWYFVTICTRWRRPLFGRLAQEGVRLSDIGRIAEAEWRRTSRLRPDVALDAFVVMPDHFHALVGLRDSIHADRRSSLCRIVGAFKGAVTRGARGTGSEAPPTIWQRSFHDSIIRSATHFDRVRRYIEANPVVAWQARRWPG